MQDIARVQSRRASSPTLLGLGTALLCLAAEGAAATGCIPQPVAKRADAGPGQVKLGRIFAARIVGHLAKVPALAI